MALTNPTARAVAAALAAHRRRTREVADLLGVTPQAVGRRLRGQTEFTAGEIRAIAEWLGVPAGSLIELPRALATNHGNDESDRAA